MCVVAVVALAGVGVWAVLDDDSSRQLATDESTASADRAIESAVDAVVPGFVGGTVMVIDGTADAARHPRTD